MNVWKRLQTLIRGKQSASPSLSLPSLSPPHVPLPNDEPEVEVPEISVETLQAKLVGVDSPLVIDVREPYEWRLVRMTAARHIPMNDIPGQLDSLPRDREVVVMCAHGSRSYSVAAWLLEQGVQAASLAGGITAWANRGGAVEQG